MQPQCTQIVRGENSMNKWQVPPEQWNYLSPTKKYRVFKTAIYVAVPLMVMLMMFGLIVETKLGL